MAPRSTSPRFTQRPFAGLAKTLSDKAISLKCESSWVEKARKAPEPLSAEEEARLFDTAMIGVEPLGKDRQVRPDTPPQPTGCRRARRSTPLSDDRAEGLRRLRELIENGKGFTLAHTAEYMAGPHGHRADHLTEALHQGHFSIQDHIDLHGLDVCAAQTALDTFFKRAIADRKQGLLVVHGRGLRSPEAPVLKNFVKHWLTRGPRRRWVVAFASAQAYDGGTGATYVLLRRSPGKKRQGQNSF